MSDISLQIFRDIRKVILGVSIFIAILINIVISSTVDSPTLNVIRLAQTYAFTAVIFLYFTLLASPLYTVFPGLPGKALYIRSRRALGQSVFFFAVLHIYYAFFKLLGGFSGIPFLGNYLLPVLLGLSTFTILSLLMLTSFDFMVRKLGRYWKYLHRLVYLVGILILFHVLLVGTHFTDLNNIIPLIFYGAVGFLLILEAIRFDIFLKKKIKNYPVYFFSFCTIVTLLYVYTYIVTAPKKPSTVTIHSDHQSEKQK